MAIIRCSNGHYYDGAKYDKCPHCGKLASNDDDRTVAFASGYAEPSAQSEDDDRTVALEVGPQGGESRVPAFWQGNNDDNRTIALSEMVGSGESRSMEPASMPALQSAESRPAAAGCLVDETDKTISLYEAQKGADFIVGWLVCVEGPERGRDYRLHQGFNRIGRDYQMDVAVMEDSSISREPNCSVVYDDRNNKFYAVQQNGAIAYLNGELLQGAQQLQTGDMIKIGNSALEFVAFCREGRVWETK